VIEATPTTAARIPLPAPENIGRIVSMSPTHTETLFALGLGEFVVAVDSESDFPEAALAVRRDDLQADRFEIDPILALSPDVVIIGDDPTGLADRLNASGVASFSGPPATSLDEVYAQIRGISAIVGRPDLGDDLVANMQASVAETVASLPDTSPRSYFHEIDPSLVTITPDTFLDSVYSELGLVSIVPADPTGFAQLTSDQVVSANPAVVILADAECCGVNGDALADRPGWSRVSAVSNGAVVEVQDYMVSRWGPRVVELLATVAAGVASAG
jgi:iron complex transport system substrate-binding protein